MDYVQLNYNQISQPLSEIYGESSHTVESVRRIMYKIPLVTADSCVSVRHYSILSHT